MPQEIKLGKLYKAIDDYKQFPAYVVLTKKRFPSEYTQRILYLFFDIQSGRDGGYLTEDEVKMVYREMECDN